MKQLKKLILEIKKYLSMKINVFYEGIKGVDFIRTDVAYSTVTNKVYQQYGRSSMIITKMLLRYLSKEKDVSFIDIGCGKGYVLYKISKLNLIKIAGLELDMNLISIAHNNLQKMKINDVEIYHSDATAFDKYSEFNYFYFYYPFSIEIFDIVVKSIVNTLVHNKRKIKIIYVASSSDYIKDVMEREGFTLEKVIHYYTQYLIIYER